MILKIMCLSIIWYHAGLMPNWTTTLERIEKRATAFLWRGGIPKVAKSTLIMDKRDGGLNHWNLKAKTAAFQNLWIIKLLTGRLNPILVSAFKAITELYTAKAKVEIPLWESRTDHRESIVRTVGSPLLAMFQSNWSIVVRRKPDLQAGQWIAYSNEEEKGKDHKDSLYKGRARITQAPLEESLEAPADWYEWAGNKTVFSPLPNNQVWHLPIKKCYCLKGPIWPNLKNQLAETDPTEIYLVTGYENGQKVKTPVSEISNDEEEPSHTEMFGPQFIKKCTNSRLAAAQLLRSDTKKIKPNKWVEKYGVDLRDTHGAYRKTFAHSKIKGFMWLLISHALPVGTRLWGSDAGTSCPRCGHPQEDLAHAMFHCPTAISLREGTFTEWMARTGDSKGVHNLGFKDAVFNCDISNPKGTAWTTLNAICLHHTWRNRCDWKYGRGIDIPIPVLVNQVWTEFEASLQARIKDLGNRDRWWSDRAYVALVPT